MKRKDKINEISSEFVPLITSDGNEPDYDVQDKDCEDIPMLALRNMVLFPGVILPVALGRKKSLNAVKLAHSKKTLLGVFCQKNPNVEVPAHDDLYQYGVLASVLKVLEMPDGTTSAILQGKAKVELLTLDNEGPLLHGNVKDARELKLDENDKEFKALVKSIKETTESVVKATGGMQELSFAITNIENPRSMINFICANVGFEVVDKQNLLNQTDFVTRGFILLKSLNQMKAMVDLRIEIQKKTEGQLEKQQKEYFLHQQMRTIQEELGDGDDISQDITNLREKGGKKKWGKAVAEKFEKELKKLQRISPHSPDYGVQENYLETILGLPWGEYTRDSLNLQTAKKILDRDHYGIEKVKERILEHLAVLKLKNDMKSPIICLYGPPGVGKTSLGKSIAEAMKRRYVRISLGGLHDESEIRGHRRTYLGSMPGRIIQSLQKAGSSNPVFILDEIDKVSKEIHGDPEAALLEVLDPEQNSTFHDNFLDIDYDLSKVMFIATANDLSNMSKPLLDRMELIDVSGYILEEKIEIAERHLVPKQIAEIGLTKSQIKIPRDTIVYIIDKYTRESGVRQLDKMVNQVVRRVAKKIVMGEEYDTVVKIADLKEYLGRETHIGELYEGNEYAGVVTGLAWTAVGGEILFIETSLCKSKAAKLTLTGNLGNVMKESASIALEYLRSHAEIIGLASDVFEETDVHIHVPEGAVPKDGPSAGITMLTSLASAFTKRKVKANLAMTGEITLRGKVLPVGGIREKILAAKRAGIKEIVMSKENQKDIEEIKPEYIDGLTFHYVEEAKDVLKIALLDDLADK